MQSVSPGGTMRKIARLLFAAGIVISTFFSQQAVNAAAKVPRLRVETITELYCGTQSGYVEFTATVSPGLYNNISLEWPTYGVHTLSVNWIDFSTPVTAEQTITKKLRWTLNPHGGDYGMVVAIRLYELKQVSQLWVKVTHDEARFTVNCHSSTPDNASFSNLD
jgi:hypothetical protein